MSGRKSVSYLAFTLALIIMMFVGAFSYRSVQQLIDNARWVTHTHQVLTAIESVLTAVSTAENGQRGYLLTSQSEYADIYNDAARGMPAHIDAIRKLIGDNPNQQTRLSALEQLVQARLDLAQKTLDLDRAGAKQDALDIVLSGRGQQLMTDIHHYAAQMSDEENNLLTARNQAVDSSIQAISTILLSAAAISVVLLLIAFVTLNQEIDRRNAVEKALRKAQDELEQRVRDRTADLAQANEQLTQQIAERVRAEQNAHAQREQYQVTLSSIGDGVIATDALGCVTFMNSVAESITGWSLAEASGRPLQQIFNIINEQTRQVVENPVERVLREGRIVGLANHTILIDRKGNECPIDDSGSPIRDASGSIIGAVLVFQNITERKKADDNLRFLVELSDALSGPLDFTSMGNQLAKLLVPRLADSLTLDLFRPDGSLERVALAAGIPAVEQALHQLTELFPPQSDRPLTRQAVDTRKTRLIESITPETLVSWGGSPDYVEVMERIGTRSSIVLPLQVKDQLLGSMILGLGYSGRHFTEEHLPLADLIAHRVSIATENTLLYRSAKQSAALTMTLQSITAALSGSLTPQDVARVVVDRGSAVLQASSMTLSLLVQDRTAFEIIRETGNTDEVLSTYRRFTIDETFPSGMVLKTGQPVWIETVEDRVERFPATAPYAQDYPGAWAVLPLSSNVDTIGVMSITFAERKRFSSEEQAFMLAIAQQTAQAIQRATLYATSEANAETLQRMVEERTTELQAALTQAQSADKMKSSMISTVSHEMRTPLSSIIGFSNLILSRQPDTPKLLEFVTYINSEARRLANLVNDFLDIQRIESGRDVLRFDKLDLASLIRDVLDKQQVEGTSHSFRLTLEDVPSVQADSARIRQVMVNLVSNAIKYSPDGGEIAIGLHRDGSDVVVSIQDHGLGIPSDELEQLFAHFRRGRSAEVYRIPGTGLGLALCREIITLHKGRIWAESSGINQGSVFSFALPAIDQATINPVHSNAAQGTATGRARHLILIVEDDPNYSAYLTERLNREDFAVQTLNFETATPDSIAQLKPALILLDVLQGQNKPGWSLLSRLKRHEETRLIPVIVSSATNDTSRAWELGAAAVVPKPIDEATLLAELGNLIAHAPRHILIVDDSETARTLLQETLSVAGYVLEVAVDGRAAIQRLQMGWPDLIVLDLMMPEVDGFAVLEWIRKVQDNHVTPVIAFTAKDLTSEEAQILKERASAVTIKAHTSPQQLLDLVRRVIMSH